MPHNILPQLCVCHQFLGCSISEPSQVFFSPPLLFSLLRFLLGVLCSPVISPNPTPGKGLAKLHSVAATWHSGNAAHTHELPITLTRWQMQLFSPASEQHTFKLITDTTFKFTSIFNLTSLMGWYNENQYFIPILLTICNTYNNVDLRFFKKLSLNKSHHNLQF